MNARRSILVEVIDLCYDGEIVTVDGKHIPIVGLVDRRGRETYCINDAASAVVEFESDEFHVDLTRYWTCYAA